MNRGSMIHQQYRVEEILHQDAFQQICLASDQFSQARTPVYITVLRDLSASQSIVQVFEDYPEEMRDIFDDFFLEDDGFYTVSKQCPGKPFPSFITNTILNPFEKGSIASHYLNKLTALDALPLTVKYILVSFGNLSIVDRKMICMNHILFFSPEDLSATHQDFLERVGDFLLCLYGNSLHVRLSDIEEGPHAEVAAIIHRCFQGSYAHIADVQKDFSPIYFRARLQHDQQPTGFSDQSSDALTSPHEQERDDAMPHDSRDPFAFPRTRERKTGRRGKRAARRRRLLVALAAVAVFFAGLTGVSRLLQTEDPNEELADTPPAQEEPETVPDQQEDDPEEVDPGEDPFGEPDPGEGPAEDPGLPEDGEVPEEPPETEPEEEPTDPEPDEGPVPGGTYTVQSGDTLYGISAAAYGDGGRYPEIMEHNDLEDAGELRAGMELAIPEE